MTETNTTTSFNQDQWFNDFLNNPNLINGGTTGSTAGAGEADYIRNPAYFNASLQEQLKAVLRQFQLSGQTPPADFSQFLDPNRVNWGAGVSVTANEPLASPNWPSDSRVFHAFNDVPKATVHSGVYDFFFFGGSTYIGNAITGNSFNIVGDEIVTINQGSEVSRRKLKDVFNISAANPTGTLILDNGQKLTLIFDTPTGGEPVLKKIMMTHPDGSWAEFSDMQDPNVPFTQGTQSREVLNLFDEAIPDGKTLFVGPAGEGLYTLAPNGFELVLDTGDGRAASLPLSASSFGGNLFNFVYKNTDGGYHANIVTPQFVRASSSPDSPATPGTPTIPGLPGSPIPFDPTNGGAPTPGQRALDDLLLEGLTGNSQYDAGKQKYFKHLLKNGRLDLSTKLLLFYSLFSMQSSKKIEDLIAKQSGLDLNGDGIGDTKDAWKNYTKDNIDTAPTKVQTEFWSNYQPENLSSDPATRQEQLQAHQRMVQGKLSAVQVDSSMLQVLLTQLVQQMQRFFDTITNILRLIHDYQMNSIRKISQ